MKIKSSRKSSRRPRWRKKTIFLWCLAAVAALVESGSAAETPTPLELHAGDRVIWLGDTLIERAQQYGYLETMLTQRWPERAITFRNLGWSGDTVYAESRGVFDSPAKGFQRMAQQVQGLKPTVIILGYGANSAFAGEAGLPRFRQGLDRLLAMLDKTGARRIILSPLRQENLGPPLPNPVANNKNRGIYAEVLKQVAGDRGDRFVNLFPATGTPGDRVVADPFTENGIHLTAAGYWHLANFLNRSLGLPMPSWRVTLSAKGQAVEVRGTRIEEISAKNGTLRFMPHDELLPALPAPTMDGIPETFTGQHRVLTIADLPPGNYELHIDDHPIVRSSSDAWREGVVLDRGPEFDQVEALRRAIVKKNRLYFYRWRPQNTTYLFGFRKHEQGQNAAEVAEFDRLVADAEQKIARLRVAASHRYELMPVAEP